MQNFRCLWIISLILSQKIWDDNPLKTCFWPFILPKFSNELLMNLELKSLELLDYKLIIKQSLYAKYYFELRGIYVDIIGHRDLLKIEYDCKKLNFRLLNMNRNFQLSLDDIDVNKKEIPPDRIKLIKYQRQLDELFDW